MDFFWDTKKRVSLDLDYSESTNTIRNCERGWYLIHRCMVIDNPDEGRFYDSNFINQYEKGDSLALLMFNLQEYSDRDISEKGLQYIDHVLEGVKKAELKAIIRFVYDWDGNGLEKEPNNIEIILNHMEQLRSRFDTYQDVIYLFHGVFVGSYGEMHSSKYLDKENVSRLMNKLQDCTPQSMMMSVRTPEFWRLICDRNEPVSNLNQLPGARIGLYNDGLCSSISDLGTYSDGTGYVTKWPRKEEIDFQSHLCRITPNGGEVAVNSEYNDLNNIVKEFPLLHISYLNRDYNMDVLYKWKTSTYLSTNQEDPYHGLDGYKYVQDHLGYRFVLRNVTVSKSISLKKASTIELEIENTGFSNMYYHKDVKVIFRGMKTNDETIILVDTDIRNWESGKISNISVPIPTNDLINDTYQIYVDISDQYGNRVKMANQNIYNEERQANALGQIKIKKPWYFWFIWFINIWKK